MSSLYWVRIGPRTVISLRGLRAYRGEAPPESVPGDIVARLTIEGGLDFELDARQDAIVWSAIQQVLEIEELPGALKGSTDSGSRLGDMEAIRAIHPPRPLEPGVVGKRGDPAEGEVVARE